jgi:hypothetical protein
VKTEELAGRHRRVVLARRRNRAQCLVFDRRFVP